MFDQSDMEYKKVILGASSFDYIQKRLQLGLSLAEQVSILLERQDFQCSAWLPKYVDSNDGFNPEWGGKLRDHANVSTSKQRAELNKLLLRDIEEIFLRSSNQTLLVENQPIAARDSAFHAWLRSAEWPFAAIGDEVFSILTSTMPSETLRAALEHAMHWIRLGFFVPTSRFTNWLPGQVFELDKDTALEMSRTVDFFFCDACDAEINIFCTRNSKSQT